MTSPEHGDQQVRRWMISACDGCGWITNGYDPDPDCDCDRSGWTEDATPEVREIEVVELAPVVEALEEAEERLRIAWQTSNEHKEVTSFDYLTTGLNGIRRLIAALSSNPSSQ